MASMLRLSLFLLTLVLDICAIQYLIVVTRYDGSTNDNTRITIEGDVGPAQNFYLTSPRVGIYTQNAYAYIKDMADVGNVCTVKFYLNGNDGWYIGKVYITKIAENNFTVFTFNEEVDNYATIVRSSKRNGNWSEWGDWSTCTASCGGEGYEMRYRTCSNPAPYCGGANCTESDFERQTCQGPVCSTTPSTTTTTQIAPAPTASPQTSSDSDSIISIGVVLALSILLNIILAVFLIIVLRDKREDKKSSKKKGHLSDTVIASHDTTYSNQAMVDNSRV